VPLAELSSAYPFGVSQGPPRLVDGRRFRLERFADLAGHQRSWAFHLRISTGEHGFARGLYVAGGPDFSAAREPRRVFHVDADGRVRVVAEGLERGIENLVVARGAYGEGLLLSEPQSLRILRLNARGEFDTFATLGAAPFGPAGLTFGSDGLLYATDFTGGALLRVHPGGRSERVASVPLPPQASATVIGAKPALRMPAARGDGIVIVAGSFSARARDAVPHGLDALHRVSLDGRSVTKLADGLTGLEFVTLGPGGAFGDGLFIATQGTDLHGDGGVFVLDAEGRLTPFLLGIDASHVVFDTAGVLGGGMFVADIANPWGARSTP